jgi:hypothetical protein
MAPIELLQLPSDAQDLLLWLPQPDHVAHLPTPSPETDDDDDEDDEKDRGSGGGNIDPDDDEGGSGDDDDDDEDTLWTAPHDAEDELPRR